MAQRSVSYQTSVIATPSGPLVNPIVAPNTILVTASGLPPNASLTLMAAAVGGVAVQEQSIAAADKTGSLSVVVAPVSALIQAGIPSMGTAGSWQDGASQWVIAGNGKGNNPLVISLAGGGIVL